MVVSSDLVQEFAEPGAKLSETAAGGHYVQMLRNC